MRKLFVSALLAVGLLFPVTLQAQSPIASPATSIKKITTSGADCSTATNCAVYAMTGNPSVGLDIQITGSATLQFESTMDTVNIASPHWVAVTDDINVVNNTAVSGNYFFTNSGFALIRVRASALTGSVVVTGIQGLGPLKTTAAVTVSGANNTLVDGVSSSIKATVKNLTNANPLATAIVDASGNQITSFGGGTQYTNGSAQATPTGTTALGWDGSNVRALSTDASGHLNVNGGGVADNTAFTQGTTPDTAVAGLYATSWSNPTAGHQSIFRLDVNGGIYANIDKIGTTAITLGTKTAASSFPVTLASDQINTLATVAKQPAFSTAGSSSPDVITVQGVAAMTPLFTTIKDSGNGDATDTTAHAVKSLTVDSTGTAVPVSDGGSGASSANTTRVIQATDSISNAVPTSSATLGGASNYATFQTSGAVLTAQIKGSAGQVYDISCTSVAAAATFVRLYDQTGAPASTDGANIVWRGVIPGATTGAGFATQFPVGRTLGTGIGIRITAAIADNDTTVLSANTVMCNVGYK